MPWMSFLKERRQWPELVGRYLPRHRRDIQEAMVCDSLANSLYLCVKLNLFSMESINLFTLSCLSKKLYKLVKKRHTHLWDKVN